MVELAVSAYAQDGIALLDRGKVQMVNNIVDPATGTIKLKADFPNARNKLWPGDFVDCKIEVESRHNGLTIPAAAIEHGPKGDFVWAVGAGRHCRAKARACEADDQRCGVDRPRIAG